jgi:adenylate kinase family enzyme
MYQRMEREAEASGLREYNPDAMKHKVQTYFDQTLPVVEYFNKYNKVSQIDANGTVAEVYAQS